MNKDDDWNEIFDNVEMSFVPIEYISKIVVKFDNNVIWDIDIDDSRKKQPIEQIEESLENFFLEYEDQIATVDYKVDLERIKKDLSKRVYKFLKRNK